MTLSVLSGSCCKAEWESLPMSSILVLPPRAATKSSNRHLCHSGSLPFSPLHIRDRGVSCEHFCPDPVFPCFTPSCSGRLIGLAGHLPDFIVLEVKGFSPGCLHRLRCRSFLHNCWSRMSCHSHSCAKCI